MTDAPDERDLEQLMRDGLERRAREVDVDVPVADRAREAARGARWRTTAAAGLVAACAAGVAGGVVLLGDNDDRSGDLTDDPTETTVVDEWRTEYWRDMRVDVPAEWGWGGAPMEYGGAGRAKGELLACSARAFRAADGSEVSGDAQETTPYVGRPIFLTDLCEPYRDDQWPEPTAPYVWLGSPIEPGTRGFDNGYVQETLEVNGSTVTVATDDPALRRQILDSATGGETCMSELETPPKFEMTGFEGIGDFTRMTVCVYGSVRYEGLWGLRYVTELPGSSAQELADAADRNEAAPHSCPPGTEYVLLVLEGSDAYGGPVTATYVVQLADCALIDTPSGPKALNDSVITPWLVDGIPVSLRYFIGPLG